MVLVLTCSNADLRTMFLALGLFWSFVDLLDVSVDTARLTTPSLIHREQLGQVRKARLALDAVGATFRRAWKRLIRTRK